MTYEEFEEEVIQSNNCPVNFRCIYKEFRMYQEQAIQTLKIFHDICVKNHIIYQLAYGSLLGAVRDGGQIPWDYDVDVYIHFEDRYDLIHALEKDLDENYYFTCAESKKKPEQYFIRIAPKGYSTDFMHVDVFYFVGMPADENEYQIHNNEIKKLLDIYTKKNIVLRGSFLHQMKAILYKTKYLSLSNRKLIKWIDTVCAQYSSYTSPFCTGASYIVCTVNSTIKKEMVKNVELYQTRDGSFYIPTGYMDVLKNRYGDYKKYPPVENRIDELLKNYFRIKQALCNKRGYYIQK